MVMSAFGTVSQTFSAHTFVLYHSINLGRTCELSHTLRVTHPSLAWVGHLGPPALPPLLPGRSRWSRPRAEQFPGAPHSLGPRLGALLHPSLLSHTFHLGAS